jgi:hypothetical protein
LGGWKNAFNYNGVGALKDFFITAEFHFNHYRQPPKTFSALVLPAPFPPHFITPRPFPAASIAAFAKIARRWSK